MLKGNVGYIGNSLHIFLEQRIQRLQWSVFSGEPSVITNGSFGIAPGVRGSLGKTLVEAFAKSSSHCLGSIHPTCRGWSSFSFHSPGFLFCLKGPLPLLVLQGFACHSLRGLIFFPDPDWCFISSVGICFPCWRMFFYNCLSSSIFLLSRRKRRLCVQIWDGSFTSQPLPLWTGPCLSCPSHAFCVTCSHFLALTLLDFILLCLKLGLEIWLGG